jgi:lysophospholipase L1-like esterase
MKRIVPLVILLFFCARVLGAQSRLRPGDRIVTLGDSITQSGGYQAFMKKVFDRFYPDLKIEIINAGISGHKSPDMLARLQADVIDKNPSIVTVSCGVNDVWHNFLFKPPKGVELLTYTRLMSQMVKQLKASTKADIYLLTPTVIRENLRSPENLKLEAYCEAIRQLAREEKVNLVDLNQLFNLALRATQTGGVPDFHPTSDGVHMKPSGNFLMAAAILRALSVPMTQILEATEPTPPAVKADDPRLQYWGRWDQRNAASSGAVTVNTGSTIIARFEGTNLAFHFTTTHYTHQLPTLWLQVDEGEWRVLAPSEMLRVSPTPLPSGAHTVRIVVKGFREWENRWGLPLVGSVVFRGVTPDKDSQLVASPERPKKLIEYLGDSITEGVLVLATGPRETWARERWPEFSDGRRTWAYQSALLVGAEPRTVGFGRLGLSIQANGGVPPAVYSFPFVYEGVPIEEARRPDAVVVNMGTNDGSAPKEVFGPLYKTYVETIRKAYPDTRIFCLRPFNGSHAPEIEATAASLGDQRVRYVDTSGWLDAEKHTTDGVHLNLEGNRLAAEKLAEILKTVL